MRGVPQTAEQYTVKELIRLTSVARQKINRCVDSGIVPFTRNEDNNYRLFADDAVRILRVYHALDLLQLRLTHAECIRAIKELPLADLEMAGRGQTLLEYVLENINKVR